MIEFKSGVLADALVGIGFGNEAFAEHMNRQELAHFEQGQWHWDQKKLKSLPLDRLYDFYRHIKAIKGQGSTKQQPTRVKGARTAPGFRW